MYGNMMILSTLASTPIQPVIVYQVRWCGYVLIINWFFVFGSQLCLELAVDLYVQFMYGEDVMVLEQ